MGAMVVVDAGYKTLSISSKNCLILERCRRTVWGDGEDVEVGLCVGRRHLTGTEAGGTYTQRPQHIKQRASCPPEHQATASGSHARRDEGCNVELAVALRFSSSPVFAPVFSLSIGLTSQVQFFPHCAVCLASGDDGAAHALPMGKCPKCGRWCIIFMMSSSENPCSARRRLQFEPYRPRSSLFSRL